jgi:hypothetical protein
LQLLPPLFVNLCNSNMRLVDPFSVHVIAKCGFPFAAAAAAAAAAALLLLLPPLLPRCCCCCCRAAAAPAALQHASAAV